MHKLYYGISDFEASAEPPKIKLESSIIDFGKISSVLSLCIRFVVRDSCDMFAATNNQFHKKWDCIIKGRCVIPCRFVALVHLIQTIGSVYIPFRPAGFSRNDS